MSARKLALFLGLIAVLACPVVAQADISDYFDLSGGLNKIDFVNREVIIRGSAAGWTIVNPTTTPVLGGDLIVSVFRAQDLELAGSSIAWTAGTDPSANKFFSGYGVQEVAFAGLGFLQYKNPTWDPFSVLNIAAGETLRLYENSTDWSVDGAAVTLASSVTSVVAGATPYAAATITGGYANLSLFNPAEGVAYAGLNGVAIAGSGAALDGLVMIPYSPSIFTTPEDLSARATVQPNSTGPLATGNPTSPWYFESYGPMLFKAVPEPGTLAMWGGFLAIGAVVALRRRKK